MEVVDSDVYEFWRKPSVTEANAHVEYSTVGRREVITLFQRAVLRAECKSSNSNPEQMEAPLTVNTATTEESQSRVDDRWTTVDAGQGIGVTLKCGTALTCYYIL
jgi:hypothetical protein